MIHTCMHVPVVDNCGESSGFQEERSLAIQVSIIANEKERESKGESERKRETPIGCLLCKCTWAALAERKGGRNPPS